MPKFRGSCPNVARIVSSSWEIGVRMSLGPQYRDRLISTLVPAVFRVFMKM
jgi:hypothetical protein